MKYKPFVLLAALCLLGLVCFLLRPSRPAGHSSDQSLKPSVESSPARIEALSQGVSRTQLASPRFATLALTNDLFRTREALWREPVADEAFSHFKDWTARYLATDSASRAGLAQEGVELAGARRAALKELIQNDPERALELTVPSGVRVQLPAEVTSLLEEQFSARGSLDVLGVLPEPGQESEIPATIRTATIAGKTYQTFTYGERLGVPTRNNIALTGIAVDDLFALSENALRILDADEAASAAAANAEPVCAVTAQPALVTRQTVAAELAGEIIFYCRPDHATQANDKIVAADAGPPSPDTGDPEASAWTEGQKKLLIIRVDFPDVVGVNLTDSGAINLISNLNNFYSEMSFSRASFALNGTGSDFTPVFRMPQAGSYYGTNNFYNQLRTDARNAASAAGYTLGNYNLDVICFGAVSGWSWAGLGYIGASGSWLRNSFSTGVAGHELGHNYGLNHANYWDTAGASVIGPGTSAEYGDPFDTMGSASAGNNHFNARYKNYLNWLQASEFVTATTNGTYRIACHDNTNSTGFRALRVVKNSSTNYWVEFRQKFTSNKWLMSGAGLRWAQSGNQKSHLLDTTPGSPDGKNDSALVIGRTFSDFDSAIHITPVGKGGTTPETLDVVVNLGPYPGNRPPTVDFAASATNVATGVVVTFAATANDADGDPLAYYWEFGDTNFGTNSPAAGKSWNTAGDYLVRCVVSDMKGGVGSKWLIVRVGSPTTFRITGNITDGAAAPVQNVRAYATTSRMGYTDTDGNYAIVGLPAGAYTVNASLYGYTFTPNNFTNTVSVGPDQSGKNFLATATVVSPPNITTQPASQSVNPGASAIFSVVASGASPLTYQWRFNGVNISGATSSSYTRSNVQATNAGNYSVVVNNAYGSATSANAVLTVNTPPVITAQPQSQTVIAGNSATFTVTATGSTPLSYQWRRNGTNIAGATSSSYTRANAQPADAGTFTVVVTNVLGSVTSSPAALTVNCTVAANATAGGTVTKSPDQASYAPGSTVTLTASHPSFAFTGWTGSVSVASNPLVVVVTTNLNVTANFQSPVPDLIVDNLQATFNGTWSTGTSASDKYSTDYRLAGSVGGSATATATFTPGIATSGFYDVYVWVPTIARGATATPFLVSGQVTNYTVSVNESSSSGGWQLIASTVYFAQGTNGYVRVSNNAGQGGNKDVVADAVRWVYSAYQTLTLPSITSQPTNVTVVAGDLANFYVSASGPMLACQWMFNGNNLAGATNGVLTVASADAGDAGGYCVVVANGAGSVTSLVATLTVLFPPQILVPPQSQRVVQGSPVTLGVSASGTDPLTFQWRVNGQVIAGATNQSLNLANVQPGNAGDYDVVVSNPAGAETSPPANLAVSVPPRLNWPQYTYGRAQFTLTGTAGDSYMVQFSTNLFDWNDVSTVTNQSGNVLFVDPQSAGQTLRFYRAKLTE